MDPVRIGCVKYLNTLPLIEGLAKWQDAGGCELVAAAPSRLIGMLLAGEVDVALASVIDAVQPVVLLPVGMIGSDGPTLTVRVFSRVPIEQVRRVTVDSESHTSVALLQVLMQRRFGVRIECIPSTPRHLDTSTPSDALLLIGDKVVTDAPPAHDFPHQLDLGAAWKELTGLPFVYAVWMCRAGEEDSLKVRAAAAMLDRARRHNAMRMDWLVASHAESRGWQPQPAAEYLGSLLKYDVGEPERAAVDKFLGWAAGLGLCGNAAPRWSGPVRAAAEPARGRADVRTTLSAPA